MFLVIIIFLHGIQYISRLLHAYAGLSCIATVTTIERAVYTMLFMEIKGHHVSARTGRQYSLYEPNDITI